MKNIKNPKLVAAVLTAGISAGAWASGFQLQNQNGAGTGMAYAGAAAVAEDASTIFFNPAGMTYLPMGSHVSLAGTVIDRSVKFTDTGTSAMPVINPITLAPTGAFNAIGGNGGDGGGAVLVPAGYYSYAVSPELRLGLGVSVTFGNKTEYDSNFAGRFSGRYTSVHQLNLNPSVAYRVNDALSLGFGVNFSKAELEFRNYSSAIGAPYGILKGDDTAWGWNAGAMVQLAPDTRLGVSYRSKIKFHLEGKQTAEAPLNIDRAITALYESPDNFSLALSKKINDRLELLADATWTGWSSLQSIEPLVASTGARASAPLRYNFKDTWRLGFGGKYQLNDAWNLRAGIAYDESPVPNPESRTMTLPDSDRTWLSFGARWHYAKSSSLDFGYAHIFFKNSSTARAVMSTAETSTLQTVRGNFKAHANLYSVQLNHSF